jgi:hypothetical protein
MIAFSRLLLIVAAVMVLGTAAAQSAPIEITYFGNTHTGPAKGDNPDIPAVLNKAVSLTNGKLVFSYKIVSLARGWEEIRRRNNVCLSPKINTAERREFAVFTSRPISIYPPRRLFVHPDVASRLTGMTSLREIVRKTNIVVGIEESTFYGEKVSPILKEYPASFFMLNSDIDLEAAIDRLVVTRRVDGALRTVEFGWPGKLGFVGFPIDELQTPLLGFVACSNGDIGQRAVALLDEAMMQPAFIDFLAAQHFKGFPKSEHTYLQEQIIQNFR